MSRRHHSNQWQTSWLTTAPVMASHMLALLRTMKSKMHRIVSDYLAMIAISKPCFEQGIGHVLIGIVVDVY